MSKSFRYLGTKRWLLINYILLHIHNIFLSHIIRLLKLSIFPKRQILHIFNNLNMINLNNPIITIIQYYILVISDILNNLC